jgi:hypothetical protein
MAEGEDFARRHGIAPEELVRACIEELITRPEKDSWRALDVVLNNNAELDRRLA